MIRIKQRRKRAKPTFRSELPLRVVCSDDDDLALGRVAALICDKDDELQSAVVRELQLIASELQHSRKLETNRATRPDANRTLVAVRDLAGELSDQLARLPKAVLGRVDQLYDKSVFEKPEPGYRALITIANAIRELSDAARITNEISVNRDTWSEGSCRTCGELESLETMAGVAGKKLLCLPQSTAWSLVTLQRYAELVPRLMPESSLENLETWLGNLGRLAEIAYKVESKARGPAHDTAQYRAVLHLKTLFEKVSRNQASHTLGFKMEYTGVPQSTFGQFVMAFMKIVEPERRNRAGLAEAIGFACWPSRTKRKAKLNEKGAHEWDQRARKAVEDVRKSQTSHSARHRK